MSAKSRPSKSRVFVLYSFAFRSRQHSKAFWALMLLGLNLRLALRIMTTSLGLETLARHGSHHFNIHDLVLPLDPASHYNLWKANSLCPKPTIIEFVGLRSTTVCNTTHSLPTANPSVVVPWKLRLPYVTGDG
ncbi:hypothetical protein BJX64DRAFT_268901 [Aspergillus heterothallicus]